MDKNYQNYLSQYSIPEYECKRVIDRLRGGDVHVLGATGALGLSLLKILSTYQVVVDRLVLYIRKTSDVKDWHSYAVRFGVKITYIYIEPNLKESDLSHISSSSIVFFLLGYAQPQKFMSDPRTLFRINVDLLMSIVDKEPEYIFYTSTSEIYTGLLCEADESIGTLSTPQHLRGPYIESKRCGEAILASMSSDSTRSVSFRVALATPPHPMIGDNRILADLVRMAKEEGKTSLKGGWESIRQYQWGPVCLLKMMWAGFFGFNKVYNIAGGQRVTLRRLAELIASYYKVPYVENKDQAYKDIGAPDSVQVSMRRLEAEMGIHFKEEPIEKLIDMYLDN